MTRKWWELFYRKLVYSHTIRNNTLEFGLKLYSFFQNILAKIAHNTSYDFKSETWNTFIVEYKGILFLKEEKNPTLESLEQPYYKRWQYRRESLAFFNFRAIFDSSIKRTKIQCSEISVNIVIFFFICLLYTVQN